MRIAYILDWDILGQSSVLNKISRKIAYWESCGHEVCFMLVSHKTNHLFIPKVSDARVFERPELPLLGSSSLKTFVGRNKAFGKLYRELTHYDPGIVYLRPGSMWYPNVSKIVANFPTVLEINSLDEEEVKLYYKERGIRYKIFRYGRRDLLRKCIGIVCLTNEIADYYNQYGKDTIVISNGVDFKNIIKESEINDRTDVIFVGTPGQLWQGFEQFVLMAKLLPEFNFHLVGPSFDALQIGDSVPQNLTCHGFLNTDELKSLYSRCAVGVGTLALFKKNMEEACPLKVREYVANGLFLILGYIDTDFHEEPFSLYIGNIDDNVLENISVIRNFINELPELSNIYNDIDLDKYSVEAKENKRLAFLKSCYSNIKKYNNQI